MTRITNPLVAAPIFVIGLVIGAFILFAGEGAYRSTSDVKLSLEILDEFTTCSVTNYVGLSVCVDTEQPVMNGYDLVSYFQMDADSSPLVGVEEFSATSGKFTYYFSSQSNKDVFLQNPLKYVPAYGGFCSWGITEETMPEYPWDADCLGPSADPDVYTIFQDRIFFFRDATPMAYFLADGDIETTMQYIADGDARWNDWFAELDDMPQNTLCAYTV